MLRHYLPNLPTVIAPVVIVLASVPLILQKVPRNPLYGFRTARTMSSDRVWYPANRAAGIAFVCAGVAWFAGGLAVPLLLPAADPRGWIISAGLVELGIAIVVSFMCLARLPR